MLNRKIGFTAVALMLLLLPVVAFASTGRLEGMSLSGDYTMDYTAIYGWPSSITGVGNLAYAELGSELPFAGVKSTGTFDRAMGAVLSNLWDGRYGAWAVHLREQTPAIGQGDNLSGLGGGSAFDPNSNTNQTFDLAWGKKFGTNSLGLQFNRSYNSLTDEVPGTSYTFKQDGATTAAFSLPDGNLNRNITGVGVGFGTEMNEKMSAEFSLLWQSRTFEDSQSPSGNKYEDNGGSNYLIGVRLMHKCSPTMTLVPVAKFYNFDLSTKTVAGTSTTFDNTLKGWQVGAAGNWQIGSSDLFVLGVTMAQNTLDEESDVFGLVGALDNYSYIGTGFNDKLKATETTYPQIFMALETQVNPWLTLRFGANKGAFHQVKVDGTTGPIATAVNETLKIKDSPFQMNIGSGVKLGNLQFDAVLDNLFYQNPFAQLVGGNNASYAFGDTFSKVSATYHW